MKHLLRNLLPAALLVVGAASALAQGDSFEYSYSNGEAKTNLGFGTSTASNLPLYYNMAIKIDNPDFQGMRVTKMTIDYPVTFDGSSYLAWVANDLGGSRAEMFADSADVTFNDDQTLATATFHGNGVTIGENGIYVGFELGISKLVEGDDAYARANYPLRLYNPVKVQNSCLMWLTKGQPAAFGEYADWTDYNWDPAYGCIGITATIAGQGKEYAVSVNGFVNKSDFAKGEPVVLQASLTNLGQTAVSTLGYEYTLGTQTGTGTLQLDEDFAAQPAIKKVFDFTLPALNEAGIYPATLKITKVGNGDNQSIHGSASTEVVVPLFLAQKKVVMEEATATWCAWCTRGLFSMDSLKSIYPETFIPTAWHASDAMSVVNPSNYFDFGGGYPGCAVDRTVNGIDPYYGSGDDNFGIQQTIEDQLNTLAYGNLGAETTWNADSTQITIKATANFGAAVGKSYTLGYLLIQNGIQVKGNNDFAQNNAYASRAQIDGGKPILDKLTKMPSLIPDFVYDDIVINATAALGIEGSLPAVKDITLGQDYTHTYTLNAANIYSISKLNTGAFEYPQDDPEYNIAKDPKKMVVVVLLINDKGQIVNGIQVPAGTKVDAPVGITSLQADSNAPAVYYNLQGQRVANPAHGNLYIRVQDQKAAKVIL